MHFTHAVQCDLFDDLSYLPTVNPDALLNLPATRSSLWDLEITISYRGSEMLKTQVSGPRVQLHYQCNALEPNTQPLCFPSTDGLPDLKQVGYRSPPGAVPIHLHYYLWFCVHACGFPICVFIRDARYIGIGRY